MSGSTGQTEIQKWLKCKTTSNASPPYNHRLLSEILPYREEATEYLRHYVYQAHEDFRSHFRRLLADSLDPLEENSGNDVVAGYPELFHIDALKGYFGEILAAVIAEQFALFDEPGWKVPAFLFRVDHGAFEQLEKMRRTGRTNLRPFGRTGDDCLAFVMTDGTITKVMYCESKCTSSHRADKISDAHQKVSTGFPLNLLQLIDILKDRSDETSVAWVKALRLFYLRDLNPQQQVNIVCYLCGQVPKREESWIPPDMPHSKYTSSKPLEAVECHISDLDALVAEVYGKELN